MGSPYGFFGRRLHQIIRNPRFTPCRNAESTDIQRLHQLEFENCSA
jgi:hypothetical protein